jgi:PIN domain nuclease of toxin-antitoxin system
VKRILLDAHVFLWWIDNEKHELIGENAKQQIMDPRNEIFVSAASSWEISMKIALGALKAPADIDQIIEDKGFSELPVSVFHGQQAGSLPVIHHENSTREHKDPFDRMLIAQAQAEGLYVMTKDPIFRQYAVRIIDAEN